MARKTSGRRNPGSYNSQIKNLQNTLTILTTMLYYTNTEKKKEMLLRKTSSADRSVPMYGFASISWPAKRDSV